MFVFFRQMTSRLLRSFFFMIEIDSNNFQWCMDCTLWKETTIPETDDQPAQTQAPPNHPLAPDETDDWLGTPTPNISYPVDEDEGEDWEDDYENTIVVNSLRQSGSTGLILF